MTLAGREEVRAGDACGRFVTLAMMSMSSAEVLVSSSAPGFITASSFANTSFLTSHLLEHRLDHDVAVGDRPRSSSTGWMQRQALVHLLLRRGCRA